MADPHTLMRDIDAQTYADPDAVLARLVAQANLSDSERAQISAEGARLVREIRAQAAPGVMEVFLAEYGLSTDEGVALMCLAEALLRVPDADTIDALIEDKIAPSDWGRHLGRSSSPLVNASTWALMLTGKVLDDDHPGPAHALRHAIKRLGEPVIRTAVSRAMKEMGRQFVLGETITSAMTRARDMEADGYTYSYDMLGEAARTEADAARYHLSYSRAISALAEAAQSPDIRDNPGISVKLSALYPRYELAQSQAALTELVPRLRSLALLAKSANMGLNVDAEEADRLALSLAVIDAVLAEPALAGWDGFGIVVQAYGLRAAPVIEQIHTMATRHDRRLMVRLVKGAYWDTEIKRAQVLGLDGFPVFTRKAATDVSYIANARRLLELNDRLYPQFATHNAHTVAAILHMAQGRRFEFQRLHGMGEALHDRVRHRHGAHCRIYAPVGAHRDLLAYLVRRLLENGANSSFVNQIVDPAVPPEEVAADPFDTLDAVPRTLASGAALYLPERANARGFDLGQATTIEALNEGRAAFRTAGWTAAPSGTEPPSTEPETRPVLNPARPADCVGQVRFATAQEANAAVARATRWTAQEAERAQILNRAAELYEANAHEIFALLCREAGKTLPDCVAELREAVDFLRYYAARIPQAPALGTWACISPWNFPLAIFTGQVAAALATGNAVLAKPAEQTPLIAALACTLLHRAGVPDTVLQLVPGDGTVGAALTSNPGIDGVAFTGSTETARLIRRAMAQNLAPGAPLIAETGGLNAMIVDSTALPEQAVQSIVESAFQSAGQRCSALRCLYLQSDIAEDVLTMLTGAMDLLQVADPWHVSTDCGPVIDAAARKVIQSHVDTARREGRVLKELPCPPEGTFVAPTLIEIPGIGALQQEVFGPVLHVARFEAHQLDAVIDDINATGFGLTFGLHTRIDDRVQHVSERIAAGNVYVNRNQIGAIVGSQPFGGEGLSGTGPKAGGPHYLSRFTAPRAGGQGQPWNADAAPPSRTVQPPSGPALAPEMLPGPTGEMNRLSLIPRAPLLCLGPGPDAVAAQVEAVHALGGQALASTGRIAPEDLRSMPDISGAIWWGDADTARACDRALAERDGPLVPLITGQPDRTRALAEKHLCVDTTASGGNADLLGGGA